MDAGKFTGIPLDTPPSIVRMQFELYRKMGPEGRIKKMHDLCAFVRSVSEAGIRHRHPEYSDEQVKLASFRLRIGAPLFRKAYPGMDIAP